MKKTNKPSVNESATKSTKKKKVIRLTESELVAIIKKIIKEQ